MIKWLGIMLIVVAFFVIIYLMIEPCRKGDDEVKFDDIIDKDIEEIDKMIERCKKFKDKK